MRLVSESNEHLIGFIASTVEKLRDDMEILRNDVGVLRDEMGVLRSDVGILRNDMGSLRSDMGTLRDDVQNIRREMATKEDLALLEDKLSERIEVNTTSIRGDIEQVQLRLDTMEHSVSSRFEHVEGEISRLRSAVYLLGRDRPDVLRLLGQINPN